MSKGTKRNTKCRCLVLKRGYFAECHDPAFNDEDHCFSHNESLSKGDMYDRLGRRIMPQYDKHNVGVRKNEGKKVNA